MENKKYGTTIERCSCSHEYQDKRYGKQMRVHNLSGKKDRFRARCTVCGKEKR